MSYICTIQQHKHTKMDTIQQLNIDTKATITDEGLVVNIYAKRLKFLENQWSILMKEQNTMSFDEVHSSSFQSKRRRIAGLYQTVKKIVDAPKKAAIENSLRLVKKEFHKLPSNTKTVIEIF